MEPALSSSAAMSAEDDTDVLPFVDARDAIALGAASNALADGAIAL
ncbi:MULTISPECIES: hypothetical protein [Xanthomonas]|nr:MULTISPECIES: hypothetical protein [Xanthomonas]